jgi:hypothetical protein
MLGLGEMVGAYILLECPESSVDTRERKPW